VGITHREPSQQIAHMHTRKRVCVQMLSLKIG
jgi:hypothetical protein